MKSNVKRLFAGPYILWMIGFTIIPLLLIVYYGLTTKSGAFTLANVCSITTPEHMKALLLSLGLSLAATAICLLLSYPLALVLRRRGIGAGSFMVFVFILPMWMNFLLRTLAWQTLLEKNGVINGILSFLHLPNIAIINTPWAIILGMVYNFLPFMILPIYNVLQRSTTIPSTPPKTWVQTISRHLFTSGFRSASRASSAALPWYLSRR